MNLLNKNEIIIKKSRFIAYYYNVSSIDEVNNIIDTLKIENKKAGHFPYACKLNNTARKSDDKEPNGTAGNPILNIIEHKQLNDVLIVVVRYFGGTKLGAGNLLRAYSNVANLVTKKDN